MADTELSETQGNITNRQIGEVVCWCLGDMCSSAHTCVKQHSITLAKPIGSKVYIGSTSQA